MNLHINKQSPVSSHEQLREQIIFLIGTGELSIGDPMPGVRALSRRLGISSNTISKVYSELVQARWLVERPGAHHRVIERKEALHPSHPTSGLDDIVETALRLAQANGYSLQQLASSLHHRLREAPPDHLLVLAPDPGMGDLMRQEILERTGCQPGICSLPQLQQNRSLALGAMLIAPTYLMDRLGFLDPPCRSCIAIEYSPLEPMLKAVTGLAQPSMIGLLSVSEAGLKTLSGMFAPAIGNRHSLHPFLCEPHEPFESRKYTIRRYRPEEYKSVNILQPAGPADQGSNEAGVKSRKGHQQGGTSTADLRCMDLLFCDSITYPVVQHPRVLKYRLLSEASLRNIAQEASSIQADQESTRTGKRRASQACDDSSQTVTPHRPPDRRCT